MEQKKQKRFNQQFKDSAVQLVEGGKRAGRARSRLPGNSDSRSGRYRAGSEIQENGRQPPAVATRTC